jgi:hypothetical protein
MYAKEKGTQQKKNKGRGRRKDERSADIVQMLNVLRTFSSRMEEDLSKAPLAQPLP